MLVFFCFVGVSWIRIVIFCSLWFVGLVPDIGRSQCAFVLPEAWHSVVWHDRHLLLVSVGLPLLLKFVFLSCRPVV